MSDPSKITPRLSRGDDFLLQVKSLKKYFPVKKGLTKRIIGYAKAVDNISFNIRKDNTFGLIGESGCGKTTVAKLILNLIQADNGQVFFDGEDLLALDKTQMRHRRKDIQIVFQDPYSSLNPRMKIIDILSEPIYKHKTIPKKEIPDRVFQLLKTVGLSVDDREKYPHEFSGGQRQRIAIARALATKPKLIVLDEPVSSLDVAIQAQILNLLKDLKDELGMAYLFIAHEMPVVKYMSDRVGVMYLGSMVETAPADNLFENCMHPYTQALISAIPIPNPGAKSNRIILTGEVPNLADSLSGCKFYTRCSYARNKCRDKHPVLTDIEPGHYVACHLVADGTLVKRGVPAA